MAFNILDENLLLFSEKFVRPGPGMGNPPANTGETPYRYYNQPLLNAYGQSECSDDTLHYRIPVAEAGTPCSDADPGPAGDTIFGIPSGVVPIGRPSHNTYVYVLDRERQMQPFGVPGELYIDGESLAPGYIETRDRLCFHSARSHGK